MASQAISCPSHETEVQFENPSTARVSLKESEENGGNRDFILRYRLTGKKVQSGLMLFEEGEEQFFLLMIQPPQRVRPEDISPRDYVFVVDVWGSMNGYPLEASKELLRSLIGSLRPTDKFNVVLFAGGSRLISPCPFRRRRSPFKAPLSSSTSSAAEAAPTSADWSRAQSRRS